MKEGCLPLIELSIQDVNSIQKLEKNNAVLKIKELQEYAIVMNSLSEYFIKTL